MGQADREARLLSACYRTYGVAASWTPKVNGEADAITVRHVIDDVEAAFGDSRAVQRTHFLFVRASERANPVRGDVVLISGVSFRVSAKPMMEPGGLEWKCEAVPS